MTDGKMDLHDLLDALSEFGWRKSMFHGLWRPVGKRGFESIRMPLPGRCFYQGSHEDVPAHERADEKTGTVEEVLAHLIARYAAEAPCFEREVL